MTTFFIAALWGTLLMTQATDNLHVEPGKQLPQSLAVHVGEKDSSATSRFDYLLFMPKSYQSTAKNGRCCSSFTASAKAVTTISTS